MQNESSKGTYVPPSKRGGSAPPQNGYVSSTNQNASGGNTPVSTESNSNANVNRAGYGGGGYGGYGGYGGQGYQAQGGSMSSTSGGRGGSQRNGYGNGYNNRGNGYHNNGNYHNNYQGGRGGFNNNRMNNYGNNRGMGGRGNFGGRGSGNYGGNYSSNNGGRHGHGPRVNEKGFHGDTYPDKRVENQIFATDKVTTTGINFDKYDDIPVDTTGRDCPQAITEFSDDVIGERLMANLALCNYTKPTPVQKYSIPIGLAGRDLMACAQTGSGKTAGFLFPTLISLMKSGARPIPENTGSKLKNYPNALILAPTRELVSQIYEESLKFCYCTGIRPVVIYGGTDINRQIRDLNMGVDLLVATPGRLLDLIERSEVGMNNVQFLILDEADRMLDMGFEVQIRRIVSENNMPVERQTFMFSATFPREIQRLALDFMDNYIFLTVGKVGSASKDVVQDFEYIDDQHKEERLLKFFAEKGSDKGLVLIFVERKRDADRLEDILSEWVDCTAIHGNRSQRDREDALSLFKSGRAPILIATDVASRGLDIPNVTTVINYDLPSNIDDYVHRIGRTGRAGHTGKALSFMNEKNRNIAKDLHELLQDNEQTIPPWLGSMCYGSGGNKGRNVRGPQRGGRFGGRDIRYENQGRYSNFGGSNQSGGTGNYRYGSNNNFGGSKFGGDRGPMSYPVQGGGGGGSYGGYGGYGNYGGYVEGHTGGGYTGGMQQMQGMPRGQPSVPAPANFTPGSGPTPGQAYGQQPGGGGSGAW